MDVDSTWIHFYMALNGSSVHGHLNCFQKLPLGGRPNTKSGDHGTPNAQNCSFILFDHVWGPARIEIYWNSIWLRACSRMTSHYIWGSVNMNVSDSSCEHSIAAFVGRIGVTLMVLQSLRESQGPMGTLGLHKLMPRQVKLQLIIL